MTEPSDAQLEEEIRKVRVEDLLVQSSLSIINLSARRIVKEDERDLKQAKVGIDACRAIVDLLPYGPQKQVREALSELQILYAKAADPPAPQAGEQGAAETEDDSAADNE